MSGTAVGDAAPHKRTFKVWRGDKTGGKLVDYYKGQGFTPTDTFSVNGWPGQVLEMRR